MCACVRVCVCVCVCVVWCGVVWCMHLCVLCLGYSVACTLVQNSRQSVYCHSGLQSNHKGDTYRRSTVYDKDTRIRLWTRTTFSFTYSNSLIVTIVLSN